VGICKIIQLHAGGMRQVAEMRFARTYGTVNFYIERPRPEGRGYHWLMPPALQLITKMKVTPFLRNG